MTRYKGHPAMSEPAIEALALAGVEAVVVDERAEVIEVASDSAFAGRVFTAFGYRPMAGADTKGEAEASPSSSSLPDPDDRVGVRTWLIGHRVGIGLCLLVDDRPTTEAEFAWWKRVEPRDIKRAAKLRRAVEEALKSTTDASDAG